MLAFTIVHLSTLLLPLCIYLPSTPSLYTHTPSHNPHSPTSHPLYPTSQHLCCYCCSLHSLAQVGTPYYIAPEVLNQSETGNRGYTMACDTWSLGVIAYMLLSGTPPFKGRRDREVLQAVRRGKYTLSGPKWDAISEEAKDFIRHLLVYNPAKRMTAEQVSAGRGRGV